MCDLIFSGFRLLACLILIGFRHLPCNVKTMQM